VGSAPLVDAPVGQERVNFPETEAELAELEDLGGDAASNPQ